ncbi:MAG: GNAT family N-acetyltransferase [Bacteroidales bacterium]|jgi:N-acetylglutamate synthase-like GNAT family acetyltransferase|nr:GNAT family N-acetyltransferase [Bacteroidales bacterium]
MRENEEFEVVFPAAADLDKWATKISELIAEAAQEKNSGLAQRTPEHIRKKINEGKAVVALRKKDKTLAGFCYIDTWQNDTFIVNSGLIVHPDCRGKGIATLMKHELFVYARKNYPNAKIFGLTTSFAVKKINVRLGYKEVPYSELTTDDGFWKGCESCVHFETLVKNNRLECKCAGMIYDPENPRRSFPNEETIMFIDSDNY